MENPKRKIPSKNYVILIIIVIITVILTFYISAWVKAYQDDKLKVSPLSGVVEEVLPEEIKTTIAEQNEIMLYVSYTQNDKIYKAEKDILKYLKDHDIVDKMLYVNISEQQDEYEKILKDTFPNITFEDAPLLIYVKNGEAVEVINNTKGVIYVVDVALLNETYELE